MNAITKCIAVALFASAGFAAAAQAEYRCATPPTSVDRQACDAAREGPNELRRYVERMNWMRANLQMSDYVDRQTVNNWEERARQLAAKPEAKEPTLQVAADPGR